MTTIPETVGELRADADVIVFKTSGTKAHLPGSECPVQSRRDHDGKRKPANVLWDDMEICPDCRGAVEHRTAEWHTPVDPSEGSA